MLKRIVVLLAGLLLTAIAAAQALDKPAREWEAGKDYFAVTPPQATSSGDKIEVLEVFSYACPHCAHFQPYIEQLKSQLPANAKFALLPAVFHPQWEPYARAFYTAQALGILDKTHQAVFDALHRDHLPLNTMDDLAAFYAKYGADPGTFASTASSFVVEANLARGNDLVRSYAIDGTPSLIVNGKYRVAASTERGIGFGEMVQIAEYLVRQEATAKSAHK
jgi:protein dithiol oxidoreductase (disulfide-forming)